MANPISSTRSGFSRYHFLDNKSQNIPQEEYYSNKGIKTDVSAFAMIKYNPIKCLMLSGNVQYRYASFDYIDYVNDDNSFNKNDNGTIWNFCNFGFNIDYTPVSLKSILESGILKNVVDIHRVSIDRAIDYKLSKEPVKEG